MTGPADLAAGDNVEVHLTRSGRQAQIEWTLDGERQSVTLDQEDGSAVDVYGAPLALGEAKLLTDIVFGDIEGDRLDLIRCWVRLRHEMYCEIAVDLDEAPAAPAVIPGASLYDRSLRPITIERYCELRRDPTYARIGLTRVTDQRPPFLDFVVSTVWFGINVNVGMDDLPWVFETMLFPRSAASEPTSLSYRAWRHTHIDAARYAHPRIVHGLTDLMTMPLITEGAWDAHRRLKPRRQMRPRLRRMADVFEPAMPGRCRLRGRRGEPDGWVEWSWDTRWEMYRVRRASDMAVRSITHLVKPSRRRRKHRSRS